MRTLLASLALCACAAFCAPSVPAQAVGRPAPEFVPVRWYNSPPITMEQLRGKAVLLVVFRTW